MKYIIITTENKENNKKIFGSYSIGTVYTRGLPDSYKGVINQEGNYKNSTNHDTDGWYLYVEPVDGIDYNSSIEQLGAIIYVPESEIFTNQIVTLTDEEIKEIKTQESETNKRLMVEAETEKIIVGQAQSLDDTEALETLDIYPFWNFPIAYALDQKCKFFVGTDLKLFKCVQPHTSQSDWSPPLVPALFTEVAPAGVIPVWVQPTGAQDAYQTGDRVHFPTINDPVYESTIDANVWSPITYPAGWQLV